jgi:hypothetical protein
MTSRDKTKERNARAGVQEAIKTLSLEAFPFVSKVVMMKAHAPQLPLLSAFVTVFLAHRSCPVKEMKNKQKFIRACSGCQRGSTGRAIEE